MVYTSIITTVSLKFIYLVFNVYKLNWHTTMMSRVFLGDLVLNTHVLIRNHNVDYCLQFTPKRLNEFEIVLCYRCN